MKKLFLLFACTLLISNFVMAQSPKIGWINSSELLSLMPEKVKADTVVDKYTKSFREQLEQMSKELQSKADAYRSSEKTMTDAIKEVKMTEIQSLQSRIESIQQSAQEKIQAKKEEVYKPILDKADKAIKEVAAEKGYDYIIDGSGGMLLYSKAADNILPFVKSKLGIK